MRRLLVLIILSLHTTLFTSAVTAQEPIINYNVHVLHNITPAQCPSMWKGQTGGVIQQYTSGFGEQNNTLAAIQSCTGCAYDNNSRDCICQTCYTNPD